MSGCAGARRPRTRFCRSYLLPVRGNYTEYLYVRAGDQPLSCEYERIRDSTATDVLVTLTLYGVQPRAAVAERRNHPEALAHPRTCAKRTRTPHSILTTPSPTLDVAGSGDASVDLSSSSCVTPGASGPILTSTPLPPFTLRPDTETTPPVL